LIRDPSGSRPSTMGLAFVDAPAQGGYHPQNDSHEMIFILELCVSFVKLTTLLHIDLIRAVHQDICDAIICQEWIQRPVAENLGYDLFKQMITIHPVKYNVLCFEDCFRTDS